MFSKRLLITNLSAVVYIILLVRNCCHGYSHGAPDSACTDLTPWHAGFDPQSSPSPYSVTPMEKSVEPGGVVTLRIASSVANTYFRGFMLHAVETGNLDDEGGKPLGTFQEETERSKLLTCSPGLNNMLTHHNERNKSSVDLTWQAPAADFQGDVTFVCTFVRDYSTFWVSVPSSTSVRVGRSANVNPTCQRDDNLASSSLPNHHQNKEKVQQETPKESTPKEPSILEVAQVSFNGFVIRVFTDINGSNKNGHFFYYEPVVLLDPSSIMSESNELLKKDLVRFKIKMWDAAIRSKVLDRLRSLPGLKNVDIQEEYVRVMPYEEVQLTAEPGSLISSFKFKSKPIRYSRLGESLNFQFECPSSAVAGKLAENLKKEPEPFLEHLELTLECRGLALGAKLDEMSSSKRIEKPHPIWIFKVSSLSSRDVESDSIAGESPMGSLLTRLDGHDTEIEDLWAMIEYARSLFMKTSFKNRDLQDQINAVGRKKLASCVLVFSVENCINPRAGGQSYGFFSFVIEERKEHGDFHLSSGIYTVKTAGNYLLNFNAYACTGTHRFDLKINGKTVAMSYENRISGTGEIYKAAISAHLPLVAGDKVGIFAHTGELCQAEHFTTSRFYGILLLDPSSDK